MVYWMFREKRVKSMTVPWGNKRLDSCSIEDILRAMGISEYEREIHRIYKGIRDKILQRLNGFREVWERGSEDKIWKELVFCLLTPQSKAEKCWEAVKGLERKGLLFEGAMERMAEELKPVRFRFNKARYIVEARKRLFVDGRPRIREKLKKFENPFDAREWMVKNIKGMGYKEASHFLRNIGLGENLAILDRHILKNLLKLGVISSIPPSLSRRQYLEIEKKFIEYAKKTGIPPAHLDFVLWYRETGKVFK